MPGKPACRRASRAASHAAAFSITAVGSAAYLPVSTWESVVVDTPISRAACVCVTSPAAISPRKTSRGSTFSATSVIITSVLRHVEQGPVAAGPLFCHG